MAPGERIRAIRRQRGLTQQHLASALDATAQAVSKWERGDNAPDPFLMPALAAMLNTSIDALMDYQHRAVRPVARSDTQTTPGSTLSATR